MIFPCWLFWLFVLICLKIHSSSAKLTKKLVLGKDECHMNAAVSDLKEFKNKNCKTIIGNLEIAPGTTGDLDLHSVTINGCLRIIGTDIKLSNLLHATIKACGRPYTSRIADNRQICIYTEEKKELKKKFRDNNRDDTGFSIEPRFDKCPVCHGNFEPSHCKTYDGDLRISPESPIQNMGSIEEIRGRVILERLDAIPQQLNAQQIIINTADNETFETPLVMLNMTAHPTDTNLLNFIFTTSAKNLIKMTPIHGYRFPRITFAKLQEKYPGRTFIVHEPGPTECYFSYESNEEIKIKDILGCQWLYGKINLVIDDGAAVSDVQHIESRQTVRIREQNDGDISHSLRNMIDANIVSFKNGKETREDIEITFFNEICYKKATIDFVKTWIKPEFQETKNKTTSEYTSVVFKPKSPCYMYIGIMNTTDNMKNYIPTERMRTIYGAIYLSYPQQHNKLVGFDQLKEIVKHMSVPSTVPAIEIHMCQEDLSAVPYIEDVDISSERDDDLLIKITGESYKMKVVQFSQLEKKFGRHRLDIEIVEPGDCLFSKGRGPLKNLTELDNCLKIFGDLYIDENTNITVPTTTVIQYISRCIIIENTQLTDLYFINLEVTYRSDECKLCVGESVSSIKNNKDLCSNTELTNIPSYIFSNNKDQCGTMLKKHEFHQGNIVIHGAYNESELSHFSHIKEIVGKIVVLRSDVEYLDLFQSLERITFTGSGAAIHLEDNPNLKELLFPALINITLKGDGVAVLNKNNPNLTMDEELIAFYKNVSSDAVVEIVVEEEEIIKNKSNFAKGFGLGVGVGIGILAVICLFGTAIFLTYKLIVLIKTKKTKEYTAATPVTALSMDDDAHK